MTHPVSVYAVIDRLRDQPKLDRAAVEQALGTRLAGADGNAAFAFYEAKDIRAGDVTLSADYREPVAGGAATAGPLLNLSIASGCPARAEVEKRYGPLAVTGGPTGRSTAEETKLSRQLPWGRLTFGFAEKAPDCLSSVTLAAS